jgi:23S rRNA (adenine2030-N6)-methyltransferase
MTASGMIVINPPWNLAQTMQTTLPWLANALGENGQGSFRFETLSPEK